MNAPSPEEMHARFETFTSRMEVRMHALETTVKSGFEGTDLQFGLIKEQFKQVGERFNQVDQRFGLVGERFKHTDARFDQIDRRLDRIEASLDRLHAFIAKLPYLIVGAILTIIVIMTFVINFASPVAGLRQQAGQQSAPAIGLLADAEAAKDDTKQVIRREGAGDRR